MFSASRPTNPFCPGRLPVADVIDYDPKLGWTAHRDRSMIMITACAQPGGMAHLRNAIPVCLGRLVGQRPDLLS
jgi:hypothetical protein